jgi:hypothetical protein
MTPVIFLLVVMTLAVLGGRFGTDSRRPRTPQDDYWWPNR